MNANRIIKPNPELKIVLPTNNQNVYSNKHIIIKNYENSNPDLKLNESTSCYTEQTSRNKKPLIVYSFNEENNNEKEHNEVQTINNVNIPFQTNNNIDFKHLEVIHEQDTPYTETPSIATKTNNKSISRELPFLQDNFSNQIPYDYLQDIYYNLRKDEAQLTCRYGYIKNQRYINEKMRAILIDWLIDVHLKFKLTEETLFLTVTLLDIYLSKVEVKKNQLQLVGVGALCIACKYEEIYSPEIRDFVYITDKSYTLQDIVKMEQEILLKLEFNVTYPSSFRFFEILCSLFDFGEKLEYYFGRYLLEMFLIDYRVNKFKSSIIAFSVFLIVIKVIKSKAINNIQHDLLSKLIDNSEVAQVSECTKDIIFLYENIESTFLTEVKNKYSKKEAFEVSKIKIK